MVKLHCEFCITFIWLSVSFTEAEKCHWDGTRGSGVMLWLMHNKREQDFHLRTTRTPALRMLLRYFQHLSDFLWTFISPHLAFKAERQISLQVPTKEFWGKNINTSSGTTPRSSMFLPITAKDVFFFLLDCFLQLNLANRSFLKWFFQLLWQKNYCGVFIDGTLK